MSIVLIDSNVIIDISRDDPEWKHWSVAALADCDNPVINPLIFAELSYVHASAAGVNQLLDRLEIGYEEIPKEGLFQAAQAYKNYRQRGGTKTAPLPDFFIGAHAAALGIPLLTRDAGRYKTYFPEVKLITP